MTPIALATLVDTLLQHGLLLESTGPIGDHIIHQLAFDSRKVGPHGLFAAISGEMADGHQFIDKAVQNGAVAVVCTALPAEAQRHPDVAYLRVSDGRAALARLAAAVHQRPSQDLKLVGITGTNGKSTTTFLVHHALQALGTPAGLIGTIQTRIRTHVLPSELTTPDPITLAELLAEMRDAGCEAVVMEVSSHALEQQRTAGMRFTLGAFTNLTHDHLDYHETSEAYLRAKKRLFDGLDARAVALYNADDVAGRSMVTDTAARVVSYGLNAKARHQARIVGNTLRGLQLSIDGRERYFRLVGEFNAYNLLCAYSILLELGYNEAAALDALTEAPPVPGRFEQIVFDNGTVAIVDYAHTPDALENVLETARALKPDGATLWCLAGCGGDRDASKRPEMGTLAERLADRVVFTSDNPRTEDPATILEGIRRGVDRPKEAEWIVDRREAIDFVARQAAAGDVILIAGKGHETYQDIGGEKHPFDDRVEIRRALHDVGVVEATADGTFD